MKFPKFLWAPQTDFDLIIITHGIWKLNSNKSPPLKAGGGHRHAGRWRNSEQFLGSVQLIMEQTWMHHLNKVIDIAAKH